MLWKTDNFSTDAWDGSMLVIIVDDNEGPSESGEEFIIVATTISDTAA